jgi:hypothetical protein
VSCGIESKRLGRGFTFETAGYDDWPLISFFELFLVSKLRGEDDAPDVDAERNRETLAGAFIEGGDVTLA